MVCTMVMYQYLNLTECRITGAIAARCARVVRTLDVIEAIDDHEE